MKKRIFLAVSALALGMCGAHAQTELDQAAREAERKLESALSRLSKVREEIGSEKAPLTNERDRLFAQLRDLRLEADRAQRMSDNQSADIGTYESDLKKQGEVVDYLVALSAEFARTLGSQLDPSEFATYNEAISDAEKAAEDPYLELLAKFEAQKKVLEMGLSRAEALVGGATYPGKAVLANGVLEEGTFVRFGPVTLFAAANGSAGVVTQGKSLNPAVQTVAEGKFDSGIVAVAKGETSALPLDSTLDNAIAIAATKETIMEHIGKGGIWMFPILAFAGLSLLVAAFKAVELLSLPKPKSGILAEILSKLADNNKEGAAHAANETPGPVGRMLQQGVKYSDQDPELVEEILYETMVETQPKVMRLLPFISITAAVAPLLGLLGTVTGMINTFNRIKIFGTGDAKSLSGGISEALITTEFGLIVAIPSLLLYAILSRTAKGYLARMEKMSISFINGIKTLA